MTYKHQGIKAVIDNYGDLLVDPSMVESFLIMTHASRKFSPHIMARYTHLLIRCNEQIMGPHSRIPNTDPVPAHTATTRGGART